jgi:hypothetical protein
MVLYGPRYASALRCIGQVLESHNIDFFELITTESDEFIVECGDPNPPYTGVLKLRFSLDSIKIIDRDNQARRRQSKSDIRFDSLPELLRATGKYVYTKRVELRRLRYYGPSEGGHVELEYQTRAGDVQSETLDMSIIRQIAVDMYKRRNQISNPIKPITRRN